MQPVQVVSWGLIAYRDALARQKELLAEVIAGAPSTIIFCEHPPVITLGRASHETNLIVPRHELVARGIEVIPIDRGGDVTLHAPGQLVAYPIIDLRCYGRDLGAYLRKLEQACVDFLRDFDIVAQGDDDRRGVWVGGAKIASIGIGVRRWVTYHGVAVNVTTDLDLFRLIRPCGLDVAMTSVARLTGRAPQMPLAVGSWARHFIKVFNGQRDAS